MKSPLAADFELEEQALRPREGEHRSHSVGRRIAVLKKPNAVEAGKPVISVAGLGTSSLESMRGERGHPERSETSSNRRA